MKQTGEWVRDDGFNSICADYDYRIAGRTRAYIRLVNGKFMLIHVGKGDLTFDTLDEAKAVAEALVAMG